MAGICFKRKLIVPERPESSSAQVLCSHHDPSIVPNPRRYSSTLQRSFFEEAIEAKLEKMWLVVGEIGRMTRDGRGLRKVLPCLAGGADSKGADQCRVRMIRSSAASHSNSLEVASSVTSGSKVHSQPTKSGRDDLTYNNFDPLE